MKSITLIADERLIEAARRQAAAEGATLSAKFNEWLRDYTRRAESAEDTEQQRKRRAERAMSSIEEMCKTVRTGGRKFTRDEMNER